MSARTNKVDIQIVEPDSPNEHISVSEALKLVTTFSGNKREVLTFISNVHTAQP
jgi:hypothetical protein